MTVRDLITKNPRKKDVETASSTGVGGNRSEERDRKSELVFGGPR